MITWESDDGDHCYDIGTRYEIACELLKRVQGIMADINRISKDETEDWRDYMYDLSKLANLIVDIDQNAGSGHLIALTPDTPTGELGWYYVKDIDIDLHW